MGAVFALFGGFYYWTPKIIGKLYNEYLGKIHFWTLFVGVKYIFYIFLIFYLLFILYYIFNKCININLINNIDNLYFNLLINLKIKFTHKKIFNRCISNKLNNNLNLSQNQSNNEDFKLFFNNLEFNKKDILKNLKGKSGVYLIINNITGDKYVGSSIVLSKRLASHMYHGGTSLKLRETKIYLYRAMIKYKLKNFSLAILDFCKADVLETAQLEQKWLNFYKPKYNILKIAGSSLGLKHSIETINKLKLLFKGENHPKFGTNLSSATRKAISEGNKEFYKYHKHHAKGKKGILSPQFGIGGKLVFCYNENNKELYFPSINAARQFFKIRWTSIKNNLDNDKFIKINNENWKFKSIPIEKN